MREISPPITHEGKPRKANQSIYLTDNRKIGVLGWKPKIDDSEGYERILAWIHEKEESLRALYGSEEKEASGVR